MKRNVLEYLEATAASCTASAVIDANGRRSYAEMLELSRRIGSALIPLTPANRPIAVLLDKESNALTAFWGIVYAGCYYTLLNPELPASRLEQVRQVLQAAYVITDEAHREQAAALFSPGQILLVGELQQAPVDEAALAAVRRDMIDTDPLYVNFTSGSTGVPKGVVIGHRSVIDFIEVFTETFGIDSSDVIGNQAPFDFDVSVKDIYSALKTGASLVIVPRPLFSRPVDLLDFLCEQKITVMIWAVSALCLISTFHGLDYKTPDTVKKVLFSGEVMPMKHLRSWMDHLPEATFVNLYGPTEITCNCTYHIIDRERSYEKIPIGRAFPNERVLLLDSEDRPVTEPGVPGELCVGGTAVGLGYFGSRELTDKHFVQNPLNPSYHDRLYRTGDLASWNEQGELLFQGRKDFQIKYQGHRIELEEIEKAMSEVDGVERACCVFDSEKGRLYGYYVGTIDRKELHRVLSQTLPVFMVPGRIVQKDAFPLNKNGKIDRKALS